MGFESVNSYSLVESLFIRLDFNIMVSLNSYHRLLNILNKILAASTPISNAGWLMVVSDGLSNSAWVRFEKLMSFKSLGMFIPISLQA